MMVAVSDERSDRTKLEIAHAINVAVAELRAHGGTEAEIEQLVKTIKTMHEDTSKPEMIDLIPE
jgi:hypothetical protein